MVTDVAVIGGGPGGAVAALELARAGARVTVVEKAEFPRFQIGESLTGEVGACIRSLGLADDMEGIDATVKRGVHVFGTGGTNRFFVPVVRLHEDGRREEARTWQVRRSSFDGLLMDAAADAGADRLVAEALEPIVEGGAVRGVVVSDGEGDRRELRSEVVVDASGRGTFLHNAGITSPKRAGNYDKQVGVFAHVTGATRLDEDDTVIFYRESGHWAWFIPIDADTTSIGVVCPSRYFRDRGETPRAFLERELRELNPELALRTGDAVLVDDPRMASNYSYEIDDFTGPGWLCIGDSHRFIDPVFSFGVHFAMHEARRASSDIVEYLGGARRDDANPFADFQAYAQRGQDVIQSLVDCFWGEPLAFGFMITKKHRDDLIDLFAGRIYGEGEPSAGLCALRRLNDRAAA